MPAGHVQPTDIKDASYVPINAMDQETYDLYDPRLFENAPLSVQLVGRRVHEEQLLAVAAAVDKAMKM